MHRSLDIELADSTQTEQLGAVLASCVEAPAIIFLQGNLGAGKTTFSRGFIQACGHRGAVKSPTYTLIEPYALAGQRIFHLDLYRLSDAEELAYLGLDDLQVEPAILLVEWPERGSTHLPPADLDIELRRAGDGRQARLRAHSAAAQAWLDAVAAHFVSRSQATD